jgi:hypothetical protein
VQIGCVKKIKPKEELGRFVIFELTAIHEFDKIYPLQLQKEKKNASRTRNKDPFNNRDH